MKLDPSKLFIFGLLIVIIIVFFAIYAGRLVINSPLSDGTVKTERFSVESNEYHSSERNSPTLPDI